jgi:hypothetical protein
MRATMTKGEKDVINSRENVKKKKVDEIISALNLLIKENVILLQIEGNHSGMTNILPEVEGILTENHSIMDETIDDTEMNLQAQIVEEKVLLSREEKAKIHGMFG